MRNSLFFLRHEMKSLRREIEAERRLVKKFEAHDNIVFALGRDDGFTRELESLGQLYKLMRETPDD